MDCWIVLTEVIKLVIWICRCLQYIWIWSCLQYTRDTFKYSRITCNIYFAIRLYIYNDHLNEKACSVSNTTLRPNASLHPSRESKCPVRNNCSLEMKLATVPPAACKIISNPTSIPFITVYVCVCVSVVFATTNDPQVLRNGLCSHPAVWSSNWRRQDASLTVRYVASNAVQNCWFSVCVCCT